MMKINNMSEYKHKENRFELSEDMPGVMMETTRVKVVRENYDFLSGYEFWTYFSVSAIFALLTFSMIKNNMTFYNSLIQPKWTVPLNILFMLFLLGFIILAYAGYSGNCYSPNEMRKSGSNVIFLLYLFLFLTWTYLLFVKKDLKNAFFFSLALFILTILWVLWLWKTDKTSAYLMLYVLVITGYGSWLTYNFMKNPPVGI
jgi:tryptophan-rich sensory protein